MSFSSSFFKHANFSRYIKHGKIIWERMLYSSLYTFYKCYFTFSYFLFKERSNLVKYFSQVRKHLKKDGMFFIDLFGGTETRKPLEESAKHKNHTYYWDCDKYNPLTADVLYYIHFKTHKDQVKHEKVFKYDWRMWDARELLDILKDAGFRQTHIYWEGVDKDGSGNGVFKQSVKAENCESWVTYICALP